MKTHFVTHIRTEELDAAALDRVKVCLYQAELAIRTKNRALAQSSLTLVQSLELNDTERTTLADEFEHVVALVRELDI